MKIRTKDGGVIDLAEVRATHDKLSCCEMSRCREYALLDALQAALSVPEVMRIAVENEWDKGFEQGFDNARKIIRQAAGVVEEERGS